MQSPLRLSLALVGLVGLPARTLVCQAAVDPNQALLNYELTVPKANQLIDVVVPMKKYFFTKVGGAIPFLRLKPEYKIAELKKDPKAMAVLQEQSLTPEDYVFGLPALRMALRAAEDGTGTTQSISAANLAFAKAHLDLKPKLDAVDAANPSP